MRIITYSDLHLEFGSGWVYGHTHECDDQTIGQTRIISNQLGYPDNFGGCECEDFDEAGLPVEVGV